MTDDFRLLSEQTSLSEMLSEQMTSQTLGRCLLSGVVAQQGVFINVLLPVVI